MKSIVTLNSGRRLSELATVLLSRHAVTGLGRSVKGTLSVFSALRLYASVTPSPAMRLRALALAFGVLSAPCKGVWTTVGESPTRELVRSTR
jgi:hypothetical protein